MIGQRGIGFGQLREGSGEMINQQIDDLGIKSVRETLFKTRTQGFGSSLVSVTGVAHENENALFGQDETQYAPRARMTAGTERNRILRSIPRLQFST